jgi:hypothetical protein
VALLAAAKLARLPIDSLLSDSAASPDRQATRLESLERQVADLTRRLEQRERQDQVASTSLPERVDVDALEGTIAELEGELYEVGRQLGRPWDNWVEREESGDRADLLRRRIGTLEARLVVVAGMVGAQAGGYPPAPEGADAEDEDFQVWLADVTAILQRQLPSILQRAQALIGTSEDRRQASDGG